MNSAIRKKGKACTRRDFLKGVGGGALGASVGSALLASQTQSSTAGPALTAAESKSITLNVNGRACSLRVKPRETLLAVLRDRLELSGAKKTCDRGECGGCTVLLDGRTVYACMIQAARLDGRSIVTVEGLSSQGILHPVQQAFIDYDAFQCGYCTPGFLMASVALLTKNPSPTRDEIKAGLSGNICRCGNYQKIYEAVAAASSRPRRS